MKIHGRYLKFEHTTAEMLYSFWISGHHLPENQKFEFIGKNSSRISNADVHKVLFHSCIMTKVPQGLKKAFPNLKILEIRNSGLKKICKNDLVEYKNLEHFTCSGNEIEDLPGDLFEDFNQLRVIDFSGNKLKVVHPNILNGINNLCTVNFRYNPNYDSCYSTLNVNDKNSTLDEIRLDLDLKYYERPGKAHKQPYQVTSGLTDDIKSFLADEATKDFKILIDDNEFPVHKFLLAARSPTLAELLKNNPDVENINLVDISVANFEDILKFLYTDELPGDDGTNFLHLFAAAGKLKIKELKNFAASKLIEQIDENNPLDILNITRNYEHDELKKKAFEQVKKKHPKVEFKDEWAADPEKMMKMIEIIKQREEAERMLEEEFKNFGM